jgi:hypothetical protein
LVPVIIAASRNDATAAIRSAFSNIPTVLTPAAFSSSFSSRTLIVCGPTSDIPSVSPVTAESGGGVGVVNDFGCRGPGQVVRTTDRVSM